MSWREIWGLLEQLGCDTSAFTHYNDGDVVPASATKNFCPTIRKAIGDKRVYSVSYVLTEPVEQHIEEFVVLDAECPLEEPEWADLDPQPEPEPITPDD